MDHGVSVAAFSFALLFTCTAASFNLFLSPLEVKELMGKYPHLT